MLSGRELQVCDLKKILLLVEFPWTYCPLFFLVVAVIGEMLSQ